MCFTQNLAKCNKVQSNYVTKHHRYGFFNFSDIQNADSRIGLTSDNQTDKHLCKQ